MFRITVTRLDGSSLTSRPLHPVTVPAILQALLNVEFKSITIYENDVRCTYTDRGPMLNLEEALKWKQPNDLITQLLGG